MMNDIIIYFPPSPAIDDFAANAGFISFRDYDGLSAIYISPSLPCLSAKLLACKSQSGVKRDITFASL